MATVTEIVNGALLLLEVRTAEAAVTAQEAEDGLASLNDMMNEWNVDGINVGYETLNDVNDIMYVDLGAIGAIKANLAVYVAPEYGRLVSASLQARADRGKKALRASINLNPSQYPETLPVGSGNEGNNYTSNGDTPNGLRDSRFYPSNERTKCS